MQKQPKAVFFDIDGTLVSFNTHRIPSSTKLAIAKLKKKGIKIFIATGRALSVIDNVKEIDFDGLITVNGGYCISDKGDIIYKHPIPKEDIERLIEYHKEKPFPTIFVREHDMILNYSNEDVKVLNTMLKFPELPIVDTSKGLDEDIFQIVGFIDSDKEEHVLKHVMTNCDSTRWYPLFVDILAKGTCKQTGIDHILNHYNIDLSETMAFGDGGNDISMLRHVALGVAMGNAEDDVKASADYITTAVDDDGVYNALKHFGVID